MNILLINHYAGSAQHGMEYRPFYLGREWTRLGHHVTIAAASYSHVRLRQPQIYGSITEQHLEGLRYVWLKTPGYRGNGLRRAVSMLAFVGQLWRHQAEVVGPHRPHAVIASSTYPWDIWPAWHIAARYRAKLIFEVHDLWPLSPIELGAMPRWHPFIASLQLAEDFAYRKADRVVSMLPKAEPYMRRRGLGVGKFVYIPNGVDVSEWDSLDAPLPELHQAALAAEKCRGRFLVGYAGAHGPANALDVLIQAAAQLRQAPVTFVLVGQGPEKGRLQEQTRRDGLENVLLLPPVARACMPALLSSMDALYIGLARRRLFRFGISPNKLFDYMMAARPILYAVEAGNDPVAEAGCGISCGAENPVAVVEAVQRLMAQTPAALDALGRNGRQHVLRHHTYDHLARRFLDVLSETSCSASSDAVRGLRRAA